MVNRSNRPEETPADPHDWLAAIFRQRCAIRDSQHRGTQRGGNSDSGQYECVDQCAPARRPICTITRKGPVSNVGHDQTYSPDYLSTLRPKIFQSVRLRRSRPAPPCLNCEGYSAQRYRLCRRPTTPSIVSRNPPSPSSPQYRSLVAHHPNISPLTPAHNCRPELCLRPTTMIIVVDSTIPPSHGRMHDTHATSQCKASNFVGEATNTNRMGA